MLKAHIFLTKTKAANIQNGLIAIQPKIQSVVHRSCDYIFNICLKMKLKKPFSGCCSNHFYFCIFVSMRCCVQYFFMDRIQMRRTLMINAILKINRMNSNSIWELICSISSLKGFWLCVPGNFNPYIKKLSISKLFS